MLIKTDLYPFEQIPAPLLCWYRENKRDLPWRKNVTPYRVWVSEIMLQQTRVEAAKEYYIRFTNALPTVNSLADCDEQTLLKLWEGLGYYSRVRNMQKAAKIICQEYGGEFPTDEKLLKSLPGIGDYTVGAIRSIAFGLPAPAVDGNVFRVVGRLTENPTDISEPKYRGYLAEKLQAVYPDDKQGCSDFTQALMELGALICKPLSPDCAVCPMKNICLAYQNGTQGNFPVLPKKKEKKQEKVYVFHIRTKDGIAVRKREKGVLKGMNELPSVLVDNGADEKELLKELGVQDFKVVKSKKYVHIFTHIRWDMTCFYVQAKDCPFEVYTDSEIEKSVSLPTAFKQCLSGEKDE